MSGFAMSMSPPSPAAEPVLRRCGGTPCPPGTCDHDGELARSAASAGAAAPIAAPPIVHRVLDNAGAPLDAGARSALEPRFGHDFSRVRVHTDELAAASAAAVGARAYTVGNHIAFGGGVYAPDTAEGRHLIAHELTHVVQQAGTPSAPASSLAVGDADSPQEIDARRAADAVTSGAPVGRISPAPPRVARQDDASTTANPDAGTTAQPGGTADAGPVPTGPVANPGGTPDAGPDAVSPPGGGPLPPVAPPAAPPRILRVEVENQHDAVTYAVPSNKGAAGRQHWVTIAGTRPDVVFQVVLDRAVSAGDPSVSGLTWESDPAGALAPGSDALHSSATVPTARRVVVRARLGPSVAEATLWALFVNVTGTAPLAPPTVAGGQLGLTANASFTGTIHPATLITDPDHPALEGANTIAPPAGAHKCGTSLAGGADHRWDMSRRIRLRNIDPAGLLPGFGAAVGPPCLDNPIGYPVAPEVGNDDTGTRDENNDPYAGGGVITSTDSPTFPYDDRVGADGDTIEQHQQFSEFARLEFHNTWWKVSNFAPWRIHTNAIKVAGHWRDNGSSATTDNAGL